MNLKDYVVDITIQLSDAVNKMTHNSVKGLIVLKNGKVYGVFTRRDLVDCSHVFGVRNITIEPFVNINFEYCLNKIEAKYKHSKHTLIPIINSKSELIDIYFPIKQNHQHKYNYPIVIMAGGLGTRLYPYTKILPKPPCSCYS